MSINRNASSSVNGWIFQICAGIYLFLDDIKNSKTLKVEGEKEDVEIVQYNGKKYIQVKCIENVNNRSGVYNHYSKALESLKDADDKQTELIYFSNISDPFNTGETTYYDYGCCYSFDELTSDAQQKVRNKLGLDFSYENLKIQIVHYYGDEATKRRLVENKISEFLSKIGENDSKKACIYDRLVTHCFANAADRNKKISKQEFVLNMIVPYLDQNMDLNTFQSLFSDEYYEECTNYYSNFLNSCDTDYQIFLKITSSYLTFKKSNQNATSTDFINSQYKNFLDYVPKKLDENIATGAIKILMYRIIQKNMLMSKISRESGL